MDCFDNIFFAKFGFFYHMSILFIVTNFMGAEDVVKHLGSYLYIMYTFVSIFFANLA